MSTPASDHAEPQPAAPRSAEEWIESWIELLSMFKANAQVSGELAELMASLQLTPKLLQKYPLMQIARKQAAASLLSERITGLDEEMRSMQKEPTSKAIPLLLQQSHYRQLILELSLEDDTLTERVLLEDISPPSPLPAKRFTHAEWMANAVKDMNELHKDPELVSTLAKRGF